jgi:hypothetical protein
MADIVELHTRKLIPTKDVIPANTGFSRVGVTD